MEVRQARAGRPFTLAVRGAIDHLKGGDPLAPVSVVVPSNLSGLSLRRLLGSGRLDTTPSLGAQGIVNVGFATPFQFAKTLAGPRLAQANERPLTTAVLAAAVRHVLRSHPGRFGEVAEHVATETALVRAYGEITELGEEQRRALAESPSARTRDLLAFVETVNRYLTDGGTGHVYHDEYHVLELAAEVVRAGPGVGNVVLAGPYGQGQATRTFLTALGAQPTAIGVVALTGDIDVDDDSVGQMAAIAGRPTTADTVTMALPTTLIPASDSDEEVRAVVRNVLARARAGARFDRMAVFHPITDPYARTLREQFELSGIPTAGPEHRALGDSMAGRLLRRLLDLAAPTAAADATSDRRFERAAVLALVEAAPVRGPDGKRVRSGAWENVSRRAGVIGGLDDWTGKLERFADAQRDAIDDPQNADRSPGFVAARQREARAADELRRFVEWLHARTVGAPLGRTWRAHSDWARSLLDDLLPAANARSGWPEVEVDAAERVELVLARVGVLDELDPTASWPAFVRAVELELAAPIGRRGRFGTGVLVAPLASAAGLDLDHVFVVGLSEGICPRAVREDTLLPDSDRALTAGGLPQRPDRMREERRRYLTALAAADRSATLVMPLGDHRNGKTRTPSRWWLEALGRLDGEHEFTAENWETAGVAELAPVRSYVQALDHAAANGVLLTPAELDLARVRHTVAAGGSIDDTPELPTAVRRSVEMLATRRAGFSRFGGDLSGVDVPAVVSDGSAVSASRLERWAGCPRRYFFDYVLGLGAIEAPERIEEISALDRGSLWHAILEDFVRDALPGGSHPLADADTAWTPADRDRLGQHAERRFDEVEAQGRSGRPLLWSIEKERLTVDLDQFLTADHELRTDLRCTPAEVELAIGFPRDADSEPEPPAVVELPDGRPIRLRGFADRVDLRPDGTPVVIDYKTSRWKSQKAELERDPVSAGTKLQLGVYSEAARQRYGTENAHAYYWFVSERGEFRRAGYRWSPEIADRFGETLRVIVDGIEGGLFPPNPGEYNQYFGTFENCRWCDFDAICPRDRDEEYEQACESGRLDDYVRLQVPPDTDADDE